MVGIALPVAAVYFLLRRGWRQLSSAEAYREVSRELGLVVDTRGLSTHGYYQGRRLWIGEVMVAWGSERRTEVQGVLVLLRPLGLGLHVAPRGARRFFRRRSPQVDTGIADLERQLEVHADDAKAAAKLLGRPSVKEALKTLRDRWPDVVLTDHAVRVHLGRPETAAASLLRLVQTMEQLAVAIEESRRDVHVPEPLRAHIGPWSVLAGRLGLALEEWLPALVGTVGGHPVIVAARREPGGHRAYVRVGFEAPRALGLRLRPQVEPDGYWSVGQDIQVGDPGFDSAFVVKGYDPSRVRSTLTAEVRERLLALREHGVVEVDDQGVHVRDAPLDPDVLERAVKTAVDAADGLGARP